METMKEVLLKKVSKKAIQDLTAIRATDAIEKAKEQLQNQRELRETLNRKNAIS